MIGRLPCPDQFSENDVLGVVISKQGQGNIAFVWNTDSIIMFKNDRSSWTYNGEVVLPESSVTRQPLRISSLGGGFHNVITTPCDKLIVGGLYGEVVVFDCSSGEPVEYWLPEMGCYRGRESDEWRLAQGSVSSLAWDAGVAEGFSHEVLSVGFSSGRIVVLDCEEKEMVVELYHPRGAGGVSCLSFITVPALCDVMLVQSLKHDLAGNDEERARLRPLLCSGTPIGDIYCWSLLPNTTDLDSDGEEITTDGSIFSDSPKYVISSAHVDGVVPSVQDVSDSELAGTKDPEKIVKHLSLMRSQLCKGVNNLQWIPNSIQLMSTGDDNQIASWVFDSAATLGGPRLLRNRRGNTGFVQSIEMYNSEDTASQLLVTSVASVSPILPSEIENGSSRVDDIASGEVSASVAYQSAVRSHLVVPFSSKNSTNGRSPTMIQDIDFSYARHYDWANVASAHIGQHGVRLWSMKDRTVAKREVRLSYELVARAFALTPKHSKKDGKTIQVYAGGVHIPAANCVAVDPSGNYVYVGYEDGQMHKFTMQSCLHKAAILSTESLNMKASFLQLERTVIDGLKQITATEKGLGDLSGRERSTRAMRKAIDNWNGFKAVASGAPPKFTALPSSFKFLKVSSTGLIVGASDETIRVWKSEDNLVLREIAIEKVLQESLVVMNRHQKRVVMSMKTNSADLSWMTDAKLTVDKAALSGMFLSVGIRVSGAKRSSTILVVVDLGVTHPSVVRCFGEAVGEMLSLSCSPDGRWISCTGTCLEKSKIGSSWPPDSAQDNEAGYLIVFDKLTNCCIDWVKTNKCFLGASCWHPSMTYLYVGQTPQGASVHSDLNCSDASVVRQGVESLLRFPLGSIQCLANKQVFEPSFALSGENFSEVKVPILLDTDMSGRETQEYDPLIVAEESGDDVICDDTFGEYSLSVKRHPNEILAILQNESVINQSMKSNDLVNHLDEESNFFLGSVGSDAFNPVFAGNEVQEEEERKRELELLKEDDIEEHVMTDKEESSEENDVLLSGLRKAIKPVTQIVKNCTNASDFKNDPINAKLNELSEAVLIEFNMLSPAKLHNRIAAIGPLNNGSINELVGFVLVMESLIRRKRESDVLQSVLQVFNKYHILTIREHLEKNTNDIGSELLVTYLDRIQKLTQSHWRTIDETLSRMECYLKLIPRLQMD
eukprot:GHVH01000212.1.p1 GENE.GHVH01000212.1~~GHVH01000212.1.p1  ORF type:complete len:1286 (-),score=186.28 GHVH01000212.1:4116-7631(-)